MALKGVLRPGYIQIRVLDMDAAVKHYVDRVGLHEVSREPDGRIYLRAWDEFDRHSVVLRRADMPGMDYVGFKVASDADPPPVGAARKTDQAASARAEVTGTQPARVVASATELLETSGALLTRTHLRELGLERRAVDAVFRALPVVAFPGYSRPLIRASTRRVATSDPYRVQAPRRG